MTVVRIRIKKLKKKFGKIAGCVKIPFNFIQRYKRNLLERTGIYQETNIYKGLRQRLKSLRMLGQLLLAFITRKTKLRYKSNRSNRNNKIDLEIRKIRILKSEIRLNRIPQ